METSTALSLTLLRTPDLNGHRSPAEGAGPLPGASGVLDATVLDDRSPAGAAGDGAVMGDDDEG